MTPQESTIERFEKKFFYRGDGLWGHYTKGYDENDQLVSDKVKAYMVPESILSFIESECTLREERRTAVARAKVREEIRRLRDNYDFDAIHASWKMNGGSQTNRDFYLAALGGVERFLSFPEVLTDKEK